MKKTFNLFIENTNGNYYTFKTTMNDGFRMLKDIKKGMRSNWMCVECACLNDPNGKLMCAVYRKDCE